MNDYAKEAKEVIKNLKQGDQITVTSSQIRKILSAVTIISNRFKREKKFTENIKNSLIALKVKTVYQAARDKNVKKYVDEAKLINKIDEIISNKDTARLEEFIGYNEALVAYHKFMGGRD